ncbi:hypothetical protein OHA18_35730 [Kribbella sp. NBC_00709]|nr:hypothetical protein [Kribbella sp. NBC_00709]
MCVIPRIYVAAIYGEPQQQDTPALPEDTDLGPADDQTTEPILVGAGCL